MKFCSVRSIFLFQAEDGIRGAQESRGLGDGYRRQRPRSAWCPRGLGSRRSWSAAGSGWSGIQAFVVDKGNPGLKAGKKEKKMGVRASHTGEVILEDCFVPDENLLGGQGGRGGVGVLKTFESTRPGVGAGAVGIARAAHEYALDYALQRHTFGKPIAGHQAIAFKLADMATEIEAARLLVREPLRA